MGFDILDITEAIKAVGPSLDNAIEFILNSSDRNDRNASTSSMCLADNKVVGKRASSLLQPSAKLRQQNITEQLKSASAPKRSKMTDVYNVSVSDTNFLTRVKEPVVSSTVDTGLDLCQEIGTVPSYCKDENIIGLDWEKKVNSLLKKNFGYSSLKGFQKEVLAAWLANQDCLVLAATGSGKPLCFQITSLLSGKVVVVVISPLVSLMHDQCLKLGKLGISACFLGSGQVDKSVENKAMNGAYSIIYVCPETILRLIKPLQASLKAVGLHCSQLMRFIVFLSGVMIFNLTIVKCKPYSSFSEWGKGWADPEIRRQRLTRRRRSRKPTQRRPRKPNMSTVRGRLSAKLSKIERMIQEDF